MPFRTGPQSPIGNGSTLTLLGTRPMEEETALDFYGEPGGSWVELVAHIEAEKTPPNMDSATLSLMHARALWKDACVCWYNTESARVLTHPTKKWVRVTFMDGICGDLRDPQAYLRSEAKKDSRVWAMMEYALFGGASANRVLNVFHTTGSCNTPILPIQTFDLAIQIRGNAPLELTPSLENLSLGFEGAAEKAAQTLCNAFVNRGSWAGFRKGDGGNGDWLAGLLKVSTDELLEGISQLHRSDFIKQGANNPFEIEIRESLVVKFWEAAVAV